MLNAYLLLNSSTKDCGSKETETQLSTLLKAQGDKVSNDIEDPTEAVGYMMVKEFYMRVKQPINAAEQRQRVEGRA